LVTPYTNGIKELITAFHPDATILVSRGQSFELPPTAVTLKTSEATGKTL
jgi:hypothetical protein